MFYLTMFLLTSFSLLFKLLQLLLDKLLLQVKQLHALGMFLQKQLMLLTLYRHLCLVVVVGFLTFGHYRNLLSSKMTGRSRTNFTAVSIMTTIKPGGLLQQTYRHDNVTSLDKSSHWDLPY